MQNRVENRLCRTAARGIIAVGVEAVLEDIVVSCRKGDRAEFIAKLVDFVEFIRLVSFRCLPDQDGSLM